MTFEENGLPRRTLLRYPQKVLSDNVVALRRWREDDLNWVARATQDEEIVRWSHLPQPFDADAIRRWFTRMAEDERRFAALRFAITDQMSGALLGAIALSRVESDATVAEVGFWLAAPARGRGNGGRALALICRLGGGLAFDALIASTDSDNVASQYLLERSGFVAISGQTAGSRSYRLNKL